VVEKAATGCQVPGGGDVVRGDVLLVLLLVMVLLLLLLGQPSGILTNHREREEDQKLFRWMGYMHDPMHL
jgi:hypothetical protein